MTKFAFGIGAVGMVCLVFALPGFAQTGKPASKAQIAHGEYLVKGVGECSDCHTPMNEKGEPISGKWLQGSKLTFGPLAPMPAWAGTAPGIAGLPGWTTQQAVHLLMTGLDRSGRRLRPPMPQFRMNHSDAEAVVAYLKSLK